MTRKLLPVQSRMARTALGWDVERLAAAARVPSDEVLRLERGDVLPDRMIHDIRRSMEAAGVEFTDAGGVHLRPKANFVRPEELTSENVD